MRIGIPREVKDGEHRVALSPSGVKDLHPVVVEPGAGAGVGFSDDHYRAAGATLVNLGPRTLRAETVPTVVLTALWTAWGW